MWYNVVCGSDHLISALIMEVICSFERLVCPLQDYMASQPGMQDLCGPCYDNLKFLCKILAMWKRNIVWFLLGSSLASEFYMPTFRNRQTSETLAYKIQPPGNYPEESIQHSGHGISLKSKRGRLFCCMLLRTRRCSYFECSDFMLLLCFFFLNFMGPYLLFAVSTKLGVSF